jgi:hypothetical protein
LREIVFDTDRRDEGGKQQGSTGDKRIEDLIVKCETDIRNCTTIKDVTDLMNSKDMKAAMDEMSKDEVASLREFGKQRLIDLGWTKPEKKTANG